MLRHRAGQGFERGGRPLRLGVSKGERSIPLRLLGIKRTPWGEVMPSRFGQSSGGGIASGIWLNLNFGYLPFWIFTVFADSGPMKDIVDHPAFDLVADAAKSNPHAASVRLRTMRMSKAKAQRSHDYRRGKIPDYVAQDRMHLNRTLVELRPLPQIHAENAQLREVAGRKRKIKSNAAVVVAGVITFGHLAADAFNSLTPEQQNKAIRQLAEAIAKKLNTRLESLVIHLDETTIHAHFMLRGYNDAGVAVSDTVKLSTASQIQDLAHQVLSGFCPSIERGQRKRDRLDAGADYADTLHRSVRQLHQDLPAEIAIRQAEVAALAAKDAELKASTAKTEEYIRRLKEDQRALNEKEQNRLKAYEERLLKKEAEQAALSQEQEKAKRALESLKKEILEQAEANKQTRQELAEAALAQEAVRKDLNDQAAINAAREADLKIDRDRLVAGELALITREDDIEARETEVSKAETAVEQSLTGFESVFDEIAKGTMKIDPETDKVIMAHPERIRLMPQRVKERLLKPAFRLVRMLHDSEERGKELNTLMARVRAWLRRDDLTREARKDGEDIERDVRPK